MSGGALQLADFVILNMVEAGADPTGWPHPPQLTALHDPVRALILRTSATGPMAVQ